MEEMDFLSTAERAARLAGDVLDEWSHKFTVSEKSPANLVTEADFASQEIILETIRERFPDHNFLGEEGLSLSDTGSPYRWIIDPLDGTSNYVHHFPYYAVSIALEFEGELIVGVVFDPNRDEMFTAKKGEGAFRNGSALSTTTVDQLRQAMVVASLPVDAREDHPAVGRFLAVLPHVQTVQRTGSAALNLSYIGAGRIDAYWSQSLKPWDMAAGALIVSEAGGQGSRMDGRPFDLSIPDILTSNGTGIHDALVKLLK